MYTMDTKTSNQNKNLNLNNDLLISNQPNKNINHVTPTIASSDNEQTYKNLNNDALIPDHERNLYENVSETNDRDSKQNNAESSAPAMLRKKLQKNQIMSIMYNISEMKIKTDYITSELSEVKELVEEIKYNLIQSDAVYMTGKIDELLTGISEVRNNVINKAEDMEDIHNMFDNYQTAGTDVEKITLKYQGKTPVQILYEIGSKRNKIPVFTAEKYGPDNAPTFDVKCTFDNYQTRSHCRRKKTAEHYSADNMIKLLYGKNKIERSFVRDLGLDGDVESNPGPSASHLYLYDIMCADCGVFKNEGCIHFPLDNVVPVHEQILVDIPQILPEENIIGVDIIVLEQHDTDRISAGNTDSIDVREVNEISRISGIVDEIHFEEQILLENIHREVFSEAYYEDHIEVCCKTKVRFWAEIVNDFFSLKLSNRYDVLEIEDMIREDELFNIPRIKTFKPKLLKQNRVKKDESKITNEMDGDKPVDSFKNRKNKDKDNDDSKSTVSVDSNKDDKFARKKKIIERLVKKFSKDGEFKLVLWAKKLPKKDFLREVCCELWGNKWEDEERQNAVQYFIYCYLNDKQKEIFMVDILLLDRSIQYWHHSKDEKWNEYYRVKTGISWFDATEIRQSEADLNNKLVHALNGNGVFSKDMKTVDDTPGWLSLYNSPNNMGKYIAKDRAESFTYTLNQQNYSSSFVANATQIVADVVQGNNNIQNTVAQKMLNTSLIPRALRDGGGVLNNSNVRLITQAVRTVQYLDDILAPTDFAETILQAVKNQSSSNWRRDNNSLSGFNMFDIVNLNTQTTIKSLSMEQLMMKLDLLHSIFSMSITTALVPDSVLSAIDNHTRIDANARFVIGSNGTNIDNQNRIFGEVCEGPNLQNFFPYGGGTGTIAFHLSSSTVPIDRRPNAIFVPPILLTSTPDPAEALALFCMLWAPWPFCNYNLAVNTVDTFGNAVGKQNYVFSQCTINIPGSKTLDFILPRTTSSVNPTTVAAANDLSLVRPKYGLKQTNTSNPFALIDISSGAGVVDNNLVNYLVSWSELHNITTIQQFIGRLQQIVEVSTTLETVHEINLSLHSLFPFLIEGNFASTFDIVAGSIQQTFVSNALCHSPQLTTQNYPLPAPSRYDRIIYETDIMTWNQVILNLRTSPNIMPQGNMIPYYYGDAKNVHYELVQAMTMSAVWNVHYTCIGLDGNTWATALNNTDMISFQKLAREHFADVTVSGTLKPSVMGRLIDNLYCNTVMAEPVYSFPIINDRKISVFSRILPQLGYSDYVTATGLLSGGIIPLTLPDILINFVLHAIPKFMMPYPSPNGLDSTKGYHIGLNLLQNSQIGLISSHFEPESSNYALNTNERPGVGDDSLWNRRMMILNQNRTLANNSGQPFNVNDGYLPAGAFLKPRNLPLYVGTNRPTGILNANTNSVPQVDISGVRIFCFLNAAAAIAHVNTERRLQTLSFPAWLIGDTLRHPNITAYGSKPGVWDILIKGFQGGETVSASYAKSTEPLKQEVVAQAVNTIVLN